jgi:hypothetical protein
MNYDEFSKPLLVEPGIKYFLHETLKKCKEYKETYNNYLYNAGLFIFFMLILGAILLYKYRGKLSTEEMQQKDREKKQYILSKIKNFQDAKRIAHQELITSLPNWDNEYELISRKII